MSNKNTASAFIETAALGDPHEAYDKFVAPDFIHHNQYFKGDRASLLEAMVDDAKTDPNTSCSIKQIIEEGDKVVAYSYITKKNMKIAVFHMFRFANGKIVEMWDIGQEILNDSPNENGLF